MKSTIRFISLLLTVLMIFSCFAACEKGDNIDTPNTPTVDYSEKSFPTYSQSGDYIFTTTEIPTFIDGNAGLRLSSLNAKFSFAADCEGAVRLKVMTQGVSDPNCEVDLKIYVDGEMINSFTLVSSGGDQLIADGLTKGYHTFTVEKVSGGSNLRIDAITLCGEMKEPPRLNVENGVYVEVFAPAGGDDEYCSFNVYTQTTHPSGEYFIRYKFVYEYDDIDEALNWSNGTDIGANRMNYRIKTGQIVKKTGESSFITVYNILQAGEISLAIKEKNPETGATAGDFVGGFHGDENLKNAVLLLDGETPVELYQGEAGLYNCSSVVFKQFTAIDRCNTPYDKVMNHNQHYLIDTNGIRLNQQVEWLTDDFTPVPAQTFLQMFTFNRIDSTSGDFLTTTVNLLDEDGTPLDTINVAAIELGDKTQITSTSDNKYRYAEYLGEEKGLYAKVGYAFIDNSCFANSAHIATRKYGDCKWYPSFKGATATPAAGEVWNLNCFYYIDYNPA